MIEFILNYEDIRTELPVGSTVLDFVRYHKNLRGTKIGCREGDCGACTIIVGELKGEEVSYRSMTSCLMPLANAAGKHIVTVEGINRDDGRLTSVQQAMVFENGTQCGFCTVGFVMSLTGFCIDKVEKTPEMAVSSIDGNICRCTGYKSIERAAAAISRQLAEGSCQSVPDYFEDIPRRLRHINETARQIDSSKAAGASSAVLFVGGGTDLYVQRPDQMSGENPRHLFYEDELRSIRDAGDFIEIGASATVTDLLESPVMHEIFPELYKHLKLVSSTPIRNMATLAGNFVNASPIGDMTIWFLGLDAEITLAKELPGLDNDLTKGRRVIPLRELYLGYKQLAKSEDEFINQVRFRKPAGDFRFNFEKVSKRTYLDIATVNTAISLRVSPVDPEEGPPPPKFLEAQIETPQFKIDDVHAAAGGVAPVPLYLKETSGFLTGKELTTHTIKKALQIIQFEVSPISDARGNADYKRLLLRQLFVAHFVELFSMDQFSLPQ